MFQIGEIVKPSGLGRTGAWGEMFGIVTEVSAEFVYVAWYGLEFEDEMRHFELVSTRQFADYIPDDLRFIRNSDGDLENECL